MASSSSSSSWRLLRPAEVAAASKRDEIPRILEGGNWQTHSHIYLQPDQDCPLPSRQDYNMLPPQFSVRHGDPVNFAIEWDGEIPFICVANTSKPGGDWQTSVPGYEEQLCRRSTLAFTLANPSSNYPIPAGAGVFSPQVVVFKGSHDRYETIPEAYWSCLPVVSVPCEKFPKVLNEVPKEYAFPDEREMIRTEIRAALQICALWQYRHIVIGDWGLGNGYRNPPRGLAELWREVFLYDPDLRGRFEHVVFVFEDPNQSTEGLIINELERKKKKKSKSSGSSSSSSSSRATMSDFNIFCQVFDSTAIQQYLYRRDQRLNISSLTTA